MFNLEQSIGVWRWHMRSAGIKSSELLDELETHLREEMVRQTRSGLNEQEAFEFSVRQIGQASLLKAEFEKTEMNEPRERKIARAFLVLGALTYLLCGMFGLLNAEMTANTRLLGFAAIAVSILFLSGAPYLPRLLPVLMQWRPRLAVQIGMAFTAVVWLLIYVYLVLPLFDCTIGQLVVATLWALAPWMIVGGVTHAMEAAAHGKTSPADV